MSETEVRLSNDAEDLAQSTADRLLLKLLDAQAQRGEASVVLTGGRAARLIYQAVRQSPARDSVDWSRVQLWWGDERFLPTGDPERNETMAREALLDALPLDADRVHPMPAAEPDLDPETAAARYADALARAARPGSAALPHFDLVLLSVGEDGHVASVFPGHPAAYETRTVAGVRGAPKPPPHRITLTLPTINSADEVWILATGAAKAAIVGMALTSNVGPVQLPAAAVHGIDRTIWLVDRAAAVHVPPRFFSLR